MIGLKEKYAWLQGDTLEDYAGAGYFPEGVAEALFALADDKGFVPVTDESLGLLHEFTGSDIFGNETKEQLGNYISVAKSFDKLPFDEVGIVKTGDYEIVFITASPISQPEYYVPYNLSSVYLVNKDLWESCKTYWDSTGKKVDASSSDIANISTNYCTSKETTMSFGPYVLDYFELDKQMTFKRNDNWYGYKDGKHKGQYQIDEISTQVIAEQATALLAFQKGEIDNTSLVAENMSTYASSPYIRYTPQSYTTKLSFNTDLNKTTERGTQIMTNWKFRKAFAMAIDRSTFAASYTSAGSAGYGLLNYLYVYDPYSGATYRDTAGAMEALVQLNGLTYGEGGDYEDLEEAYDAITNYDMNLAQKLMKEAYEDCVKAGLYKDGDEVKIQIRVYNNDDVYVQMFNYLKGCLESACKGSGFEGKVTMEMVVDADYYETNYSGGADMIFTTWGGATYSPWTTLYECYCDAADGSGQQMEYGFDTSKISVTMKINDKDYTAPLQTWALWCDGDLNTTIKSADGTALEAFNAYDNETKAAIFGRLEYSFLSFFATTPIYYRNTGSLVSQKGDYAVKEYIDLIQFGGWEFYTFEYDDAEWEKVKADLNY